MYVHCNFLCSLGVLTLRLSSFHLLEKMWKFFTFQQTDFSVRPVVFFFSASPHEYEIPLNVSPQRALLLFLHRDFRRVCW